MVEAAIPLCERCRHKVTLHVEADLERRKCMEWSCACERFEAPPQPDHDRCPHCDAPGLVWGHGLAAGGCGTYAVCERCDRYSHVIQDDDDLDPRARGCGDASCTVSTAPGTAERRGGDQAGAALPAAAVSAGAGDPGGRSGEAPAGARPAERSQPSNGGQGK